MHVFVNFRHYLWIEPKSGIVAYKALQYSQITDNIYEAFMMAWGRAARQLRIYLPCGLDAQKICAPLSYGVYIHCHHLLLSISKLMLILSPCFYVRQQNASHIWASICPVVRPSVTLLYCIKTVQARS